MSTDIYNGLMSEEFCQTPQYLGSLDEVKAQVLNAIKEQMEEANVRTSSVE